MQMEIDTSPLHDSGALYELAQVDAFDWLSSLPAECVDLVITDPPYESLEKHRAVGTTTRLQDWFPTIRNADWPLLLRELWRILRKDSHCYVFTDAQTLPLAIETGKAAGFRYWKPLVWDKDRRGMGYHYAAQCEFVVFFEKGTRPLNSRAYRDIFPIRPPRRHNYPTEKPRELLEVLVRNSSDEGEILADPFFGSGVAAVAALSLGRRFIGTDTNPKAHRHAECGIRVLEALWRQEP